ncbi:hypothetical protein BCR32DRAFT_285284 [Anaeromyces robustus]|uniref:Uncharacterized protein n=1 Tax=Anaeromyces robustus TaxID=1754192 RepID=A0A1Y1WP53_9FUNG|nr:hypothetical protein BCR32DRAFT_285284 [Anaeromyces robustus]|eukprot:ORX75321.1 hypothetical protein BCR32DRAFT_285284 [Anaeromyces robustus]
MFFPTIKSQFPIFRKKFNMCIIGLNLSNRDQIEWIIKNMPERMFNRISIQPWFDPNTAIGSEMLDWIYSELTFEENVASWRGRKWFQGNKTFDDKNKNKKSEHFKPKRKWNHHNAESNNSKKETSHLTIKEVEIDPGEVKEDIRKQISYHTINKDNKPGIVTIESPVKVSFFISDTTENLVAQVLGGTITERIQGKINNIQQGAPTEEVAFTKAFMSTMETTSSDDTGLLEVLCLLDSGSNCNYISSDLAKALNLKQTPKKTQHVTSGGRTTTQGEVNVSFGVFDKDELHGYILKNVKMSVLNSPKYMFSIGKQMERKYNLPFNNIKEIIVHPEPNNNNQTQCDAITLGLAQVPKDINSTRTANKTTVSLVTHVPPNSNIPLNEIGKETMLTTDTQEPTNTRNLSLNPLVISENELSDFEELGTTSELISHHAIFKAITRLDPKWETDNEEQEITIKSEENIINNEKDIKNLLPKELIEFKDVFRFPEGLPPSRGEWDFKLNIDESKIKDLTYQEPIRTNEKAKRATHDMLKQYLKDQWIQL